MTDQLCLFVHFQMAAIRCRIATCQPRSGTATTCRQCPPQRIRRCRTCIRPMAATRPIRGYRTLLTTARTPTLPMRTPPRPMPTTTTWPSTAAYSGYHSTTATVRGKSTRSTLAQQPLQSNPSVCLSFRLHHDQTTAHALESAAAYSSYPTMAGESR